jgi:hypothetical protein
VYRDWIGIRPEDLTDANRTELEHDHGLAAVHRAELNLGLQLKGLPATSRRLSLRDVSDYEAEMGPFVQKEGRSTWLYGVPVLVVCVAGLVLLTISNKGARSPLSDGGFLADEYASRTQALAGDPRGVSISIDAHQASGDRALPQGATLRGFESAKLTVHVAGTGYLSVYDLDEPELVYPQNSEPWFVLEGSWQLGDASPLLFENSQYSSSRNFLAALCERFVVVEELSAIDETLAEQGCLIGTTVVQWESQR